MKAQKTAAAYLCAYTLKDQVRTVENVLQLCQFIVADFSQVTRQTKKVQQHLLFLLRSVMATKTNNFKGILRSRWKFVKMCCNTHNSRRLWKYSFCQKTNTKNVPIHIFKLCHSFLQNIWQLLTVDITFRFDNPWKLKKKCFPYLLRVGFLWWSLLTSLSTPTLYSLLFFQKFFLLRRTFFNNSST